MPDPLLLIAILIVVIAGAIFAYTQTRYPKFEPHTKLTQTVLTTLALGLAGYWYLVERKGEPHANVTQTAEVVRLSEDVAAIEVQISIKNLGSRLLKLVEGDIRLQQVSPPEFDAAALERRQDKAYFDASSFPGEAPRKQGIFDGPELNWKRVNRFRGPLHNRIEPGETDLIVATFLIRCDVRTARIATQIKREDPRIWGGEDGYWWKARTLVNVQQACRTPTEAQTGEGK